MLCTRISQAFDKLDHGLIIKKMHMMGFHRDLLKFFISYLRNRTQFVEVGGFKSGFFKTPSGAPQGSNLAPLIFAIFINDVTSKLTSFCRRSKIISHHRKYKSLCSATKRHRYPNSMVRHKQIAS